MKPIIVATHRYAYLGDELAQSIAASSRARVETKAFPDAERYLRLLDPVHGSDVVLVGGTVSDDDTLELFDLASGIVAQGARRLSIVIPYFGYATMERMVQPGEVVTAKTRARLLSAIPQAAEGNRLFLVDLHAEGIPYYFEGPMRPVHVYAKKVIIDLAHELAGNDLVLACTDAGRAKWVESLANDMNVSASFVLKRRLDGSHTEVTAVSAQVEGRVVVVYDDMIRTGGSLMGAAKAYKSAGAAKLVAITTHGVFPGNALETIYKSGLFSAIACTNTHPRAVALAGPHLKVASIADVLARAITGEEA